METLSLLCISSALVLVPVALLYRKGQKKILPTQSNQSSLPASNIGSPQDANFDQRPLKTTYNLSNRGTQYSQVHNRGRQ